MSTKAKTLSEMELLGKDQYNGLVVAGGGITKTLRSIRESVDPDGYFRAYYRGIQLGYKADKSGWPSVKSILSRLNKETGVLLFSWCPIDKPFDSSLVFTYMPEAEAESAPEAKAEAESAPEAEAKAEAEAVES